MSDYQQLHPHRRFNPLKNQWVLVAPHRFTRPWSGKTEELETEDIPINYNNPLMPGAMRTSQIRNPMYTSTYVFDNDFPTIRKPQNRQDLAEESAMDDLFKWAPIGGTCRIVCYTPKPDASMATMSIEEIVEILNEWTNQTRELSEAHEWVQIFENKGTAAGCSNPHPHCQIYAGDFLPTEPLAKELAQKEFYRKTGEPMLLKYLREELRQAERIIDENEHWVTLVPYWAVWPYETMLIPKRSVQRFTDLRKDELITLATIIRQLLIRYDNIFNYPFPYSMLIFQAPSGKYMSEDQSHWTFHISWHPPLLLSPTVRKFMGGYEQACEPLRDLSPEKAAAIIQATSTQHYLEKRAVEKILKDTNDNLVAK